MSWDSYIDNLIAHSKTADGTCHVDKACIIGLDGGGAWTSDAHANAFVLNDAERKKIADAMKSGDSNVFAASGILAGGVKYQFLRMEDGVAFGKKKGEGAITLQKSTTAVVIGHTFEGGQQGCSNKAVAVIAEYLQSLGY